MTSPTIDGIVGCMRSVAKWRREISLKERKRMQALTTTRAVEKLVDLFVGRAIVFICPFLIMLTGTEPAVGQSVIGDVDVLEVTDTYDWGYQSGIKQPLGAFKNGLSVHQISKSNWPAGQGSNPDHILWVDELNQEAGVSTGPTGSCDSSTGSCGSFFPNTGGTVGFDGRGRLWFGYSGRAHDLPLSLFVTAGQPAQPRRPMPNLIAPMVPALENFVTARGATALNVLTPGPRTLMVWRHGRSGAGDTTVHFRGYESNSDFSEPVRDFDIGIGAWESIYGQIGIEQLWAKYDPKYRYVFVTWQWFRLRGPYFGSNPFLYSADFGSTWRMANERPVTSRLPISFHDRNRAELTDLVPYDHLDRDETTGWHYGEIGVSPRRVFWLANPKGHQNVNGGWQVYFWRFVDGNWEGQPITGAMHRDSKPYSCGVTDSKLVCVYADLCSRNRLKARVSHDDGASWSAPVTVASVPAGDAINWVSFVQPADRYDEAARFFFSHHGLAKPWASKRFQNKIKWIKLDLRAGAG